MPERRTPSKTTSAATRYQKEWRLGRRRLVGAGPVLAHIARLEAAGWSLELIGLRAGMSRSAVGSMVRRQPEHVRAVNARAILALRPADLHQLQRPAGRVPALGARRRVGALMALGWTYEELQARTDVFVRAVMRQDQETVTARVHREIAALYDDLCMTPGPSAVTRARALRAGHAPPLAWDDNIDDPDATPDYGATSGREAPLDDWLHLVRLGVSTELATRQCGTTTAALERAAYRHGRTEVLHHLGIHTTAA